MFQTAAGVTIPFPERMKEEYQVYSHSMRIVVSFEKIQPMLFDFIAQTEEPLFIVLEMPSSQQEESKLRTKDTDSFHKNVCYLDGQTKQQVLDILTQYGDILLNDGISQFAVASHATNDEFYIQKYKLIDLYSNLPNKFFGLMDKYGLTETSDLLTPWDTFSREHPGNVTLIRKDGEDIYTVYESLCGLGLYIAKVVED